MIITVAMMEWIGFLAGLFTTVCYFPQLIHVLRTKDTRAISLPAYSILFLGIALWVVYGWGTDQWPVWVANGITLPMVLVILLMKLRHH